MLHSLDLSRPRHLPNIWEAVSENNDKTTERPMPLNSVRVPFPADLSQNGEFTQELFAISGASLVYAGYPYDPFRTDPDLQ
jgi:hypothetical protein